jgi:hypothetical protein
VALGKLNSSFKHVDIPAVIDIVHLSYISKALTPDLELFISVP